MKGGRLEVSDAFGGLSEDLVGLADGFDLLGGIGVCSKDEAFVTLLADLVGTLVSCACPGAWSCGGPFGVAVDFVVDLGDLNLGLGLDMGFALSVDISLPSDSTIVLDVVSLVDIPPMSAILFWKSKLEI